MGRNGKREVAMICTECNQAIPFYEEDITVHVVFKDGHVEHRCHHRPFDDKDAGILAILGSRDCFERYAQRAALSATISNN